MPLYNEINGYHYKFTENIKNKPKVIGACANVQNIWFQRNAHGTTGNKNHCEWKTKSMCYMEQTHNSGMVFLTSIGTLKVLQSICDRNIIRENFLCHGIIPSKCKNAKSVVSWYNYASSAIFSGSVTKSNAKPTFCSNQWHTYYVIDKPCVIIQYHS